MKLLLASVYRGIMTRLMNETTDNTLDLQETNDQSNGSYGQEILAFIWETIKLVIVSLLIIIPVRYFLIQPFFVKGASMENTFHDGDYILIDEISYRFQDPVRGDITVFRFPQDQSQFFIKRVIGLPGETIEVKDNTVTIFNRQQPNGFRLAESYLSDGQITFGNLHIVLSDKEYFVMGDNRLHSSDSRSWGTLPRPLITGRVFFRAWPLTKIGAFQKPTY